MATGNERLLRFTHKLLFILFHFLFKLVQVLVFARDATIALIFLKHKQHVEISKVSHFDFNLEKLVERRNDLNREHTALLTKKLFKFCFKTHSSSIFDRNAADMKSFLLEVLTIFVLRSRRRIIVGFSCKLASILNAIDG